MKEYHCPDNYKQNVLTNDDTSFFVVCPLKAGQPLKTLLWGRAYYSTHLHWGLVWPDNVESGVIQKKSKKTG